MRSRSADHQRRRRTPPDRRRRSTARRPGPLRLPRHRTSRTTAAFAAGVAAAKLLHRRRDGSPSSCGSKRLLGHPALPDLPNRGWSGSGQFVQSVASPERPGRGFPACARTPATSGAIRGVGHAHGGRLHARRIGQRTQEIERRGYCQVPRRGTAVCRNDGWNTWAKAERDAGLVGVARDPIDRQDRA